MLWLFDSDRKWHTCPRPANGGSAFPSPGLRPPSPHPMGRDFPEMKIRAFKPLNRGKTSNIQHRTPNAEMSEDSRCHAMFGVGCSMLDVPRGSWKAPFRFSARIGTMNHPSPDLRPPSPHRMARGKG